MTAAVVDDVAELTPAWLTEALRGAGLDVTVADVRTEPVGTGQMGSSHRLHLTYAGAGHRPEGAPATLVAKIAGGDPATRGMLSVSFTKEVGFYREVADTVAVRCPKAWHAGLADGAGAFTLLLEDIAGARPGVQADGCTPAQALDAVRNLAGLHAPRWDDDALLAHDFMSPADEDAAAFLGLLLGTAADGFLERYAGQLADEDVATLRAAADANATWLLTRARPFAVTHGDYRLDNLMFPVAGDGVCALDWQTVTLAPPLRDVAYFLGNSLLTGERRRQEERLVAAYHDELVARGVEGYGADDCWLDYRLGQLQGPMITILGAMFATAERSDGADRMFLAMAARTSAAIRDLDPFALL